MLIKKKGGGQKQEQEVLQRDMNVVGAHTSNKRREEQKYNREDAKKRQEISRLKRAGEKRELNRIKKSKRVEEKR